MNKLIKRIFICFSIFCALVMFSNQALAITMSFNPSDSIIGVGDSIGIDIVISGMESNILAAFDFNINYDDTILDFDSYSLGSELGFIDPSDPSAEAEDWSSGDLGGGIINLAEVSWRSTATTTMDLLAAPRPRFPAVEPPKKESSISMELFNL